MTNHIPERGNDKMSLNYLGSLIGTEVKINRGGPDSIVGRLISVQHDYLVLQTQDGTVFIQLQHIKSISSTNSNVSRSNRSSQRSDYAYTFEGLLGQLRYTFVQINRGGPEKIEGLVVEVWNNFLLLVVKDDIVRIPIFHIKSISASLNRNNNNSNNSNKNNNNNNNKSNGNKNNSNGNKNNSNGNKNNSGKSKSSNKSNKATAAQIVAVKLLLKKYRAR
jgi:spore coat protein B